MVKVGIIGCGKIAQRRHVPEYASNIHAKIIGYFDARKEAAEALAAQYGGKLKRSVYVHQTIPTQKSVFRSCVPENMFSVKNRWPVP